MLFHHLRRFQDNFFDHYSIDIQNDNMPLSLNQIPKTKIDNIKLHVQTYVNINA